MLDGCGKQSQGVFTYESVKSWDVELGVDGANIHCAVFRVTDALCIGRLALGVLGYMSVEAILRWTRYEGYSAHKCMEMRQIRSI